MKINNKIVYIKWDNENAKFVNVELQKGKKFKVDYSKQPKNTKESIIIGNLYENSELIK